MIRLNIVVEGQTEEAFVKAFPWQFGSNGCWP